MRALKLFVSPMIMVGLVMASLIPAYALSSVVTQSVIATVPAVLSLTCPTGALAFTFPDYVSGTSTNILSPIYTAKCNSLTATGRVDMSLSGVIAGMDFMADGQTYAKTSGTASLLRNGTVGTYTTLNATAYSMYKQKTDSGTGKSSLGTFVVNYKFVSTADLDAGGYGPVTLTVAFYNT